MLMVGYVLRGFQLQSLASPTPPDMDALCARGFLAAPPPPPPSSFDSYWFVVVVVRSWILRFADGEKCSEPETVAFESEIFRRGGSSCVGGYSVFMSVGKARVPG